MKPKYKHKGFLEVGIYSDIVEISYAGNMGATLKNVKKNFLELYPSANFEKVLAAGQQFGAPDYAWFCELPKSTFHKLTKGVKC